MNLAEREISIAVMRKVIDSTLVGWLRAT